MYVLGNHIFMACCRHGHIATNSASEADPGELSLTKDLQLAGRYAVAFQWAELCTMVVLSWVKNTDFSMSDSWS